MKKKIFVMIAVVAAVMALGIGTALAFGPPAENARAAASDSVAGGYGTCDGTCDGIAAAPQDGTGNQYGGRACEDETCTVQAPGYSACDGIAAAPQDGTGNRFGATNSASSNLTAPRGGRLCGRNR